MGQKVIEIENSFEKIEECIKGHNAKSLFLVCDEAVSFLDVWEYLSEFETKTGIKLIQFSAFAPNPRYESVVDGVEAFRRSHCDFILAIGGGSAIDVAKSIKLFACSNPQKEEMPKKYLPNEIPLAVMPTTAGSGSEATRFAVLYLHGKKMSLADDSILPLYVFLDSRVLKTLPDYQKKSAMLDAFCHAIESFWSVNSTAESKELSARAIRMVLANKNSYLKGDVNAAKQMLFASHIAGQAINITQTTAAHAMSYQLTSMFGLAHGHAAFLCLLKLLPYTEKHLGQCCDSRGQEYLFSILRELAALLNGSSMESVAEGMEDMYQELKLITPACKDDTIFRMLTESVNPERLRNHPIALNEQEIEGIYRRILGGERSNES